MLDDIESAVIDGDDLVGQWRGYKILYSNGVVKGNEPLLDAVDEWEELDTESTPKRVIWDKRGNLVYQILKQLNDITETDARELATQGNLDEIAEVWSER